MGKNSASKLTQIIKNNYIFGLAVIIAILSHGMNMFHFPYFENDEATYLSQAWSILQEGRLSPYTYWYDHAPVGWFLIAAWLKFSGGLFTFGFSLNSGRIFMMILHALSSALLYFIVKRISKSDYPAFLAVFIYSLTPLGIYFQRRLLLDNIMTFWVLLSLAMLLIKKRNLLHYFLSALFLGIAILSKENAIFFGPALFYVILNRAHRKHRIYAISLWLTTLISLVSSYFLFASLKGELLPAAQDGPNHVSLVSTLQMQLDRGNKLPFWEKESDFYRNFTEWIIKDPIIITMGVISTALSFVFSLKIKRFREPALFSALFWAFLMRGSLVIDFYIIPLIPFLALNIALLVQLFSNLFKDPLNKYVFNLIIILLISLNFLSHFDSLYLTDETTPQLSAVKFIKKNVKNDAILVTDNYAYLDLKYGDDGYANVHWFWKVMNDPAVAEKINYDWKNIEYILLSHETVRQMEVQGKIGDVLRDSLNSSVELATFGPASTDTHINLEQYISTNGDWAAVYKRKSYTDIILGLSWDYYRQNFIHSYGQVIDPQSGFTTSEGQSYALLKAIWINDRQAFDSILSWTQDHMQYRGQDKLFSWQWDPIKQQIIDSNTASDADIDIAYSLLLAYEKWGEQKYLDSAQIIISDIWKQEIKLVNGRYVLVAAAHAKREGGFIINPSYINTAAFKKFAQYDGNNWNKLTNDSYWLIKTITDSGRLLPPNWAFIDTYGQIHSPQPYVNTADSENYGFDAFRLYWRLAYDYSLNQDPRAFDILYTISQFFADEWLTQGSVSAIYSPDGKRIANYETPATNSSALLAMKIGNNDLAKVFYQEKYIQNYNFSKGYWGDAQNYYNQNWAWFALALYNDSLD